MASFRSAVREAELYCAQCREFDRPRLENEVHPDGVICETDIAYIDDGSEFHLLDVYYPSEDRTSDTAYFLFHGGAFVYGNKELDKNFGMRLALSANIPVVSINYTLLPDGTMSTIIDDIKAAKTFVEKNYGFTGFHYTGDSAGGALAVLSAIMFGDALSVSPICGCYTIRSDEFPGVLFAGEEKDAKMPPYIYDLKAEADKLQDIDVAIITGDEDFLRDDNVALSKLLPNAVFYDAVSTEDRKMTHVFPIGNPTWPEGARTIGIISSFARKSC